MTITKKELTGKAQTVLGPIDVEELGITLPHEHFLLDMGVWFDPPKIASEKALAYQPITMENLGWVHYNEYKNLDNVQLLDEELAIKEAMLFKKEGGKTIVDVTNVNLSRDPAALVRISQVTGLNIIMGSGYYVGEAQGEDFDRKSEEEIAEEIVRDITVGVDDTGICSGIIGEVGGSWPLQDREKKSLRASARAQKLAGAPITLHTGRNEGSPLEMSQVLDDAGADMSHVAVGHLDREVYSLKSLLDLAKGGCYLQYDGFGDTVFYSLHLGVYDRPSDIQRIRQIMELIDKGYLNQILISHDVCLKTKLVAYGDGGYAHILRNIVPQMRARGVSAKEIHTILVENPKRFLQFH